MLIAFDIGNTNIVMGCFKAAQLVHEFRLSSDTRRTEDEYLIAFHSLLGQHSESMSWNGAIISSVVPPITNTILKSIERFFEVKPLLVGPGIKTGLSVKTSDPAAVGSDRIVNAVAAKKLFGLPALVIDFGTATSFDYVDADSNYQGGLILPGIEISIDALVRNTAKLPRIEIAWPERVVGKNTVSAMQSGLIRGYRAMIDGLVEELLVEVGPIEHIIATGGLGALITKHSKCIGSYEPHLTLKGLAVIAELNGLNV